MSRKPVRRSAWVLQPKKEKAILAQKFGVIERGRDVVALSSVFGGRVKSLSVGELRGFLLLNMGDARNVIRKMALDNNRNKIVENINKPKFMEGLINSGLSEDSLRVIAATISDNQVKREVPKLLDKVTKNLDKYIKARGIPYNRKVFEFAVSSFLFKDVSGAGILRGRIDPRAFESLYLSVLKDFRRKEISIKTLNNFLLRRAFPKEKITSGRRGAAEKWLKKNFSRLAGDYAKGAFLKKSSFGEVFVSLGGNELKSFADFVSNEMRKELGHMFDSKDLARQLPLKGINSIGPVKKLGSREERIAQHMNGQLSGAEEAEERKLRGVVSSAKDAAIAAGLEGKKFSAFDYVLNNEPNRGVASRFRRTVSEGLLNQQDVIRLYSKGSLAIRIFFSTLDSNFVSQKSFSKSDVPVLADLISSIGPKGKRIDALFSGTNADKKKAIFYFLENRGIIEVEHGGGDVVYLHRPQTGK